MVEPIKMYKVVLLGEAGVGKSSLMRRYTQGYFSARTRTTVGVDRIPITVDVAGEKLHFQVLDTSGCYGFRGLIQSYMNNVDAVIFMYDVTSKESFASLPLWNSILGSSGYEGTTKILVGNKRDLEESRQVWFHNAKNYAEFEGMVAMEISVKEAECVDLVFQCVARELHLKKQRFLQLHVEKDKLKSKAKGYQSVRVIDDPSHGSIPTFLPRRFSLKTIGRKQRTASIEHIPLLNRKHADLPPCSLISS